MSNELVDAMVSMKEQDTLDLAAKIDDTAALMQLIRDIWTFQLLLAGKSFLKKHTFGN